MSSYKPVKLVYDVIYSETGLTPIVLLHGANLWRKSWRKVAKVLANRAHRKVYSVDARNHGDSPKTDECDISIMVKDVDQFLIEQQLNKVILIGHSMGGKVAMDFVHYQLNKVEKLVVEECSPKPLPPEMTQVFDKFSEILKKCLEIIPPGADMETAQRVVKEHLNQNRSGGPSNRPDDGCPLPLEKKGDHYIWKTNSEAVRKMPRNFQWNKSAEGLYRKPVLFVYGTQSFLKLSEDANLITKLFPNITFHSIEGASHFVHTEYPDEFCDAVLAFLKE